MFTTKKNDFQAFFIDIRPSDIKTLKSYNQNLILQFDISHTYDECLNFYLLNLNPKFAFAWDNRC